MPQIHNQVSRPLAPIHIHCWDCHRRLPRQDLSPVYLVAGYRAHSQRTASTQHLLANAGFAAEGAADLMSRRALKDVDGELLA